MMDEAELLRQLGAKLPARKDGRIIAPPVPELGESAEAHLQRPLDAHKAILARSRTTAPAPAADRAPGFARKREAFQHLHDWGVAHGAADQTLRTAIGNRRDPIDRFVADGDEAWMRFYLHGTHDGNLYGMAPTGKHIGVPAVDVSRFGGAKWKESWCFGDELGLLLQLGKPDLLLEK
jgi:hypothetical protein